MTDEPTTGQLALARMTDAGYAKAANIRAIRSAVRHPPFDSDAAAWILEALAAGLPLRTLVQLPDYPPYGIIRRWRLEHAEFDAECVAAMEAGADALMWETLAIADDQARPAECRNVSIKARHALAKALNPRQYNPDRGQSLALTQVHVDGDIMLAPADAYLRMLGST